MGCSLRACAVLIYRPPGAHWPRYLLKLRLFYLGQSAPKLGTKTTPFSHPLGRPHTGLNFRVIFWGQHGVRPAFGSSPQPSNLPPLKGPGGFKFTFLYYFCIATPALPIIPSLHRAGWVYKEITAQLFGTNTAGLARPFFVGFLWV